MLAMISTKTHAAIDYAWAAAAAALPDYLGHAPASGRLLRRAAFAATVNSTLTRYEAGIVPVLSMRTHLVNDFVLGAVLLASPFLLPRSERSRAIAPMCLGAAAIAAGLMTVRHSPAELQRSLEDSIDHDLDIARAPALRTQVE